MREEVTTTTTKKGVSAFMQRDDVKAKFAEVLGKKANGFVASVLSVVNSNDLLKNADQNSVFMAAMMAASLDLPINSNLGHAFIIPYNTKQKDGSYVQKAQFQISAKGFKQLAIRSGQFKYISDAVVYEGQLINENPLTGFEFDWNGKKSDVVVGYVSYFKLLNGFESTFFMTSKEIEQHGKKYSKTFGQTYGLWQTDRDKMALKTVTKLNLSKNAPLSIEMQRAAVSDQAIIKDSETLDVEYVDAPTTYIDAEEISADKEYSRITNHINGAKTVKALEQVSDYLVDDFHKTLYEEKLKMLGAK